MKKLLKSSLRILIAVCVLVELIGLTCMNLFMFHPGMVREAYDASSEGYVDLGMDGDTIAAVVLGPRRGRKAILRCHGNAESMYQSVEVLRELTAQGFTVASVDYPGYGLSSGRPTETGCYRNVHRLYDWLVAERGFAPEDIIVDGFSIGTGSATELAATRPIGGLILEAPFLSASRVVTRVRLLPNDPFPNAERIASGIACPLLILHGTADRLIPFAHGEGLFRLSQQGEGNRNRYRRFLPVPGAGHVDIPDTMGVDRYLTNVVQFIERACGGND